MNTTSPIDSTIDGKSMQTQDLPWITMEEIHRRIDSGEIIFYADDDYQGTCSTTTKWVYNVTRWIKHHPGGSLPIMHMRARDATDAIVAFHPPSVLPRLKAYRIGKLDISSIPKVNSLSTLADSEGAISDGTWADTDDETPKSSPHLGHITCPGELRNEMLDTDDETDGLSDSIPSTPDFTPQTLSKYSGKLQVATDAEISREFRRLNQKLEAMGLYDVDTWFYVKEFIKYSILYYGIMFFGYHCNNHPLAVFASALCTSILWWQGAFASHDLGHNGVTHVRKLDSLLGIFIADFLGGLSIGWWKKSHYTHHQETNDPENDPDIQHLPFFAVTTRFVDSLYSTYHEKVLKFGSFAKFTIPFQHYYYYLVLSFGRFNLYAQSWMYLLNPKEKVHYRRWEIAALVAFSCWYLPLIAHFPTWRLRLLYILVSNLATGILHVQITLSHFAMSTETIYNENWAARALRTSMNVDCPEWLDWFHGGLQFQVEHHLFPRLTRSQLRKAKPLVHEFCKETGLPYYSFHFGQGNGLVLNVLRQVANQVALMNDCASDIAHGNLGVVSTKLKPIIPVNDMIK